jgi:iron-sulfur cluster repair protein YtfE (RIC family)
MTDLAATRVLDLVERAPGVAEVLAEYGIVFCPGCYVALASPLDAVAAYNAVRDVAALLRRVADALEAGAATEDRLAPTGR